MSALQDLDRSEMTYIVSSGALNSTHSLTPTPTPVGVHSVPDRIRQSNPRRHLRVESWATKSIEMIASERRPLWTPRRPSSGRFYCVWLTAGGRPALLWSQSSAAAHPRCPAVLRLPFDTPPLPISPPQRRCPLHRRTRVIKSRGRFLSSTLPLFLSPVADPDILKVCMCVLQSSLIGLQYYYY